MTIEMSQSVHATVEAPSFKSLSVFEAALLGVTVFLGATKKKKREKNKKTHFGSHVFFSFFGATKTNKINKPALPLFLLRAAGPHFFFA